MRRRDISTALLSSALAAALSSGSARPANGEVVPASRNGDDPGRAGFVNVMQFLSRDEIDAVTAGSQTRDVSAAIQAANDFLEGRASGSIESLGMLVGGAGYADGVHEFVALGGGSGRFASADITVVGGRVTSCIIANRGNGYSPGNTLTVSAKDLGGSGGGFSVRITGLRAQAKRAMPGGTLFFPAGRYYCGTTGLRIGDMVRWVGDHFSSTRLAWSNDFTGNAVTIGPDETGGNGRSGYYAMGAALENIQVECGDRTAWGIYTRGAQQNCYVKDLWVTNVNRKGGLFIEDHKGGVYFKIEDVYVIGGSNMESSVVGIHSDGGACVELSRVSMNGNSQPLLRGIEHVGGGLLISDFQCELAITHIDIDADAGGQAVSIDNATLNLARHGAQGIWIHTGFKGTVVARGIDTGPYGVAIRNDNTNERRTAQITGGLFGLYVWSGTSTDVSVLQNTVLSAPRQRVAARPELVLNVEAASSFDVEVAQTAGFTLAPPALGSNPMLATGRVGQRILIRILNTSGGVCGPLAWDPIFRMSPWTNPAAGHSRALEFEWNGTNWVELWQAAADVPL